MKIGIFDSGTGGLVMLKSIVKKLPQYDYLYLGDTKRVPYGGRSLETIYRFTKEAVEYLLWRDCELIILACNTASAEALRRIQDEFMPKHYPKRKVLGVIIPAVEAVTEHKDITRVGVLATEATVNSNKYPREFKKNNPKIKVFQNAAPLLVPLIEHDGIRYTEPMLRDYLKPLLAKKVQAIILGCTHYALLKKQVQKIVGKKVQVFAQDDFLPGKVADYLKRHPEIEKNLTKKKWREFLLTDLARGNKRLAEKWFGGSLEFKLVKIGAPTSS